MGLKCPKCGTDNLLTAIFCRGCGDKLDLDAMKPEVIIADKKQGMNKQQVIGTSVFFGIIIIIGLMIICPAGAVKVNSTISPEMQAAFETVRNGAAKPRKKKKGEEAPVASAMSFTFTDQDATNLMSTLMGTPKKLSDNTEMKQVSIQFKEGNVVRVVVSAKEFGFIPVDYVVKVKYNIPSGEGSATGEAFGRSMGLLPTFGALSMIVDERTKMVNSYSGDIRSHAKAATTSAGKITIEL